MRYKDLKTSLSFLLQYGFIYEAINDRNRKEQYVNKYGKIVLEFVLIDPNYYSPQKYIDINGWKTIIDVNGRYKYLNKWPFHNFHYKAYCVLKNEVEENNEFFTLKYK